MQAEMRHGDWWKGIAAPRREAEEEEEKEERKEER